MGEVSAVAVVFHGGKSESHAPTSPTQLAVLRMVPFARALRRAGHGELAVITPRFTVRGWNGAEASPVADAEEVLGQVGRDHGDVPVHLVGHSMGARTALRVAGHPLVRSVAALAPWLPPGEPVAQLAGRRVLIAHGTRDRWTDPAESLAYAVRARDVAADLRHVDVVGDTHPMLRRARVWHELVVRFVLDAPASVRPAVTNLLSEATSGQVRLTL